MAESKKIWWIVAAFVFAAVAGVAARLWIWPPSPAADRVSTTAEDARTPGSMPADGEILELQEADLYFPSAEGGLKLHRQALPAAEPLQRVAHLVRALIEGPGGVTTSELYSPLPAGTTLTSVYRLANGAVALDLRSPGRAGEQAAEAENEEDGGDVQAEPAPAGSGAPSLGTRDELLAVYSLVNTVTMNQIEGVDRVVLLWDGRQPETFAGHLDLSRPLAADSTWVLASP